MNDVSRLWHIFKMKFMIFVHHSVRICEFAVHKPSKELQYSLFFIYKLHNRRVIDYYWSNSSSGGGGSSGCDNDDGDGVFRVCVLATITSMTTAIIVYRMR